ncbi:uncharacterized protein MELLADRAFT_92534 [Melampsora larici-populina 98AG31]|uniref:Uncharacterized protein n=1 Tax=Melampsora larici-populina (strain 98AG31 / pathotype 3-4-7) TaxID=747676 RepID=F4S1W6_MELLP|nr:uncharacterized protein MELLADRAFT_92534 [Melampsora larici-populina 98AG31]EGG01264.1 hypothetical protein MELLADRAFT_92534 [Melampsora larici-populina 98AG31]
MPPKPKSKQSPKLTKSGLPRKPRRTKAALASDAALCGQTVRGKQTRAELRQSRLAAEERDRLETQKSTTSRSTVTASRSQGTSATPKSRIPTLKSPALTPKPPSASQPSVPASQPSVPASQATQNGPLFQRPDYERIVTFLSVPKNRDIIFGLAQSPATYLSTLAKEINTDYNTRNQIFSQSKSHPNGLVMNLTGRTLEARIKRYKARYHRVRELARSTGQGLKDEQRAKGFDTPQELLEHKCPFYAEMDAIFKDKPNISAFAVMDTGTTSTSNPLPAEQSSVESSEMKSEVTHVSDSEEEQTQEKIHPFHPDRTASHLSLSAQDNHAEDYEDYEEDQEEEEEAQDQAQDENNSDYRISTRQESESRLQAFIASLTPDLDLPFPPDFNIPFPLDPSQAEFEFPDLPPPIDPSADYCLNMPPGNFSPVAGAQPVVDDLYLNLNKASCPADNPSTATNHSILPPDYDPVPELELHSGNEDILDEHIPDEQPTQTTKKPKKKRRAEALLTAEEMALDSGSDDNLPTQTTKKPKKKRRAEALLTAEEMALDSGSDDDSEILGPSKKRMKQSQPQSRKSTGPNKTIVSRPMDPLPSIDPSAVRTKDLKNPIAVALMTSSHDRNKEIRSNNIWRRNLEMMKQKEAADAEVIRKQEVQAVKLFEQQKLEKEHIQAQIVERSKFAQSLILSGKSPQEVTDYLAAVFPAFGTDSLAVASSEQS